MGGAPCLEGVRWQAETTDGEEGDDRAKKAEERTRQLKMGVNGPFTHTKAVGGRTMPANRSDEEMLGQEYRENMADDVEDKIGRGSNIQVVETWTVDRSSPVGSRVRY